MPSAKTFRRQKELGVIPPEAELTSARRRSRLEEMPVEDRPILARQMEVYAGFWSTPTIMSGADRRAERPGDPRGHPDLLYHWRQRRLGRRHAPGTFNEGITMNTITRKSRA